MCTVTGIKDPPTTLPMGKDARSAWEDAFTSRTREFRDRAGFQQKQMAALLGVPAENYRKYEGRTCLPHYLIPRFCLACKIDYEDLFNTKVERPKDRPDS